MSWVEMHSFEYLLSLEYLMLRHFLPEISSLLTLLNSSVLFPANIGPMMSSILPLCGSLLRDSMYLWSIKIVFFSYPQIKLEFKFDGEGSNWDFDMVVGVVLIYMFDIVVSDKCVFLKSS